MTASSCSWSRPHHFFFVILIFPFLSLAQELPVNINGIIWEFPSNSSCPSSQQSDFSSSQFSNNLKSLVSSIPSLHSNTYNFYNLSVGITERVEAIGICNRVLTRGDCLNCIYQAAVNLTTTGCPEHREAYIRATKCMFRYSDKPIFGKLETIPVLELDNPNNSATGESIRLQRELLNGLRQRAAAGGSMRKYAQGNITDFLPNRTFFAVVQCTPDLSEKDCNDCLNYGFRNATKGRSGIRWFCPSCNFQLESNLRFFGLESQYEPDLLPAPPEQRPEIRPEPDKDVQDNKIKDAQLLQLDFETIRVATNDFSPVNQLGEGGFGAVYKGVLDSGEEIAVKRLSLESGQGDNEFINEVSLVAKLQHRNLVRLLGFCLDGQERLLIYEFFKNTSLDNYIFDSNRRTILEWETRYQIIVGVARGLLYLHEDSRFKIIHRDVKASNVLLDDAMHPKIADFGMAKLFDADQPSQTSGYMAPEYAMNGLFSVKTDVYSFGVLVLEIITGKKNNWSPGEGSSLFLPSYVWKSWREGKVLNTVDLSLVETRGLSDEIMKCIHIGLLCVQEKAESRPTMASVVVMFNATSFTLPRPLQPAFYLGDRESREDHILVAPTMTSNEITITDLPQQFSVDINSSNWDISSESVCSSQQANFSHSRYFHNLKLLVSSIRSLRSNTYNFYNLSIGPNSDKDRVEAIGLCNRVLTRVDCLNCISHAANNLTTIYCPGYREAHIRSTKCMFRYSDKPIFGKLTISPAMEVLNPHNATANRTEFISMQSKLLNQLRLQAARGGPKRKYAQGDGPGPGPPPYTKFYATTQCTPDLSHKDCDRCLRYGFRNATKGRIGIRWFCPSCNFQIESDLRFFLLEYDPDGPDQSMKSGKDVKESKIKDAQLFQMDIDTIRLATNDFSPNNHLGEGGFGAVYKGVLVSGEEVAVKRLSMKSGQGDNEFINEVSLVAKLQHRNLVTLLGFCLDGEERLLIYEFFKNTSLEHYIFDSNRRMILEWKTRKRIISGVARGLLYLHEDSRIKIIHRDLKASNVLLDDEMYPKIADFGMAKLFDTDQTNQINGYMAPEYAMNGQFSVKTDVYSFGVLVLEIITGKKHNWSPEEETSLFLLSYVWKCWREGKVLNIVDPSLIETKGLSDEIMKYIHIGLLCVQENAESRPTMAYVVVMLSASSFTLPRPSQPGFCPLDGESSSSRGNHTIFHSEEDVAVKRFPMKSGQGNSEFTNQVNLFRLLGVCLDEQERLFIYEFFKNTSLTYYIFGIF
ncbi:hypothetical protein Bca101_026849 [Brassica carinata]